MSLDKGVEHKKEHRKQYYKLCEQVDRTCRPHGSCSWCAGNRLNKFRSKIKQMNEEIREAYEEE